MPTAAAAVAADPDLQDRRAPPQRHVRELPHDGVAGNAFSTAAVTPAITLEHVAGLHDSARQHRVVIADLLPDHRQTEPIQQAERVEIRTAERRLRHVEVFRMGSVRTPIIGRPRPLPSDRRAHRYTLNYEEPD